MENLSEKTELRKYLLGIINTEPELTPIEENLFASEDYFQELLMEEEDLIQDYVDGHLDLQERECFEKFFLNSAERHEKVKFAESFRKLIEKEKKSKAAAQTAAGLSTVKPPFWTRFFAQPAWATAGGLAILLLASLLIWNFAVRVVQDDPITASLNQAYRKERPFESRITGFDYAETKLQRRGKEKVKPETIPFDLAKNKALQAVSENPSAENLHSLGKVYLAERELDKAIEQLEKAQRLAPKNANLASDLGVAWLEKSKTIAKDEEGKSLVFLAKSLEEFEKALELNPTLLEALFNKAVCLEEKKLTLEAIKTWRQYLEADSSSKWADEARSRIKQLEQNQPQSKNGEEILQDFLAAYHQRDDGTAWKIMSQNREMITGKLITQQLAFLFFRTQDRNYLEALKYAGNLEKQQVNDPFWQEIAEFYQRASATQLKQLGEAQSRLQAGYKAYLEGKNETAIDEFKTARRFFIAAGDVWEANLAAYWIGFCHYILNNLTESKAGLKALEEYCRKKKYHWLAAHALFWVGVNLGSENQKSATLDYYQKALESSDKAADSYNSQKILSELAEEYRLLGRTDLSLEYLQKSLHLGDTPESSLRQKSRTYIGLVRTFYSLQSYKVALAYEKENRELLKKINSPAFEHESDTRLGLILSAQKKYMEALEVLEKSRLLAETMQDEKQRGRLIAISNRHLAELKRQTGDFEAALANYDEAIIYYDAAEYKAGQYDSHKGRLFCYLALGNDVRFRTELETVFDLFEKYRREILDEQNRNVFFNNEQNVYDLAVDYEYGNGNLQRAFDYAEKSSSRSLLDLLENGGQIKQTSETVEIELKKVAQPLPIDEIRRQMPAQVQLVKFNVLNDKVLIWLVSKDNFEVVSSKIAFDDLQGRVRRLKELIENKEDENEIYPLSTELYQILLTPVSEKLSSKDKICLIPDKLLFQLPFGVLTSPLTNKPLLAEKDFFMAPSANVFLSLSKNAEKFSSSASENILSIGNPQLYQSDLPDLPSAKNEAVSVAKNYQNPILLLENDAAKERVKQNLDKADVIHFAGHYVVNERFPLLSSLILRQNSANEEEKNYKLANYELLNQNLKRTKLVVLSACQTGIENYYQGEGMIGASRSFLAAGIPLVVASQWAVDSDAPAEIMIRLHQYRKIKKLPTRLAVRQAQLDLLNGDDSKYRHPYYWASFITIGGYAEF